MRSMTESVNIVSDVIAKLTKEPAERFSIACCLVEMYRYEMNKLFIPMPEAEQGKPETQAPANG